MTNEIKEILDDLDYCKSLKAGNILLKYNECDLLLDYITNLQQRIDKAVEYIENNELYYDKELGLVEMMGAKSNRIPVVKTYNLLNILRGDE